jgi:MFS family permease
MTIPSAPASGTAPAASAVPAAGGAPFRRVLRQPVLRRVLPAMLVSALGDGMSLVAVAWLALALAPPEQAGVWTGLAIAAYTLPATLGAAVLGRPLGRLAGVRLVAVDASLRAVALGVVAVLGVAGVLSLPLYVALLAGSSLLHAWGHAGAYTLIAEALPEEDRVYGNALLSGFTQAAMMIVGPALAGIMTSLTGPAWVIGVDAATFLLLAVICWPIRMPREAAGPAPDHVTMSAWRVILGRPQLLGLIVVTCVFFFLYGPVEVALPVHIKEDMNGSPGLLGAFWAVFGVGAVLGGLGAGLLRHRRLWAVVVSIVVGWGIALLPLGLTDAVTPALVGFALGGLIYGPFTATSMALVQRISPPAVLSRVLATRAALTTPSTALGTLLGGPLVAAAGGRRALLISALLTIGFGVLTALAVAGSRLRPSPDRRGS